jgi:hypothetical protein
MKCQCLLNDTISNITDLANYDYAVKKSLLINGSVALPNSSITVFRATDEITISGNFEVPLGSELEIITHQCPE